MPLLKFPRLKGSHSSHFPQTDFLHFTDILLEACCLTFVPITCHTHSNIIKLPFENLCMLFLPDGTQNLQISLSCKLQDQKYYTFWDGDMLSMCSPCEHHLLTTRSTNIHISHTGYMQSNLHSLL